MPPNQGRPGGHQRSRNRWRGCPGPLRDRLKPEPFSSPSVSNGGPSPSRVPFASVRTALLYHGIHARGREGRRATRGDQTSGVGIDEGVAPACRGTYEGLKRDRLTLQLAISVRGQLQICNSAPLHAGPILPRSTRLAELYLARRGRLCTATGRDRSTGYSQ